MRPTFLSVLAMVFVIAAVPSSRRPISAQAALPQVPPAPENPSGSVICPPGIYLTTPDDCLPLGPSSYLTQLAESGLSLPLQPLPAYAPDPSLNAIPYSYFHVSSDGASLYGSLSDAMNGTNPVQQLDPGTLYVSYIDRQETDQGVFYQLRNGLWIGGDGSRISIPGFQGLLFSSTPHNSFGWLLGATPSYTSPDKNSPQTGRSYYRYNVVQVYSSQLDTNGKLWKLIGPDEWIPANLLGQVDPRTTPPPGVPGDRWIEVNLQEQTLAVYDKNKMVFATLIASGVEPFWTRPGLFKIYIKQKVGNMSGVTAADRSDYYYIQDVPWTMYFDEERALHGAFWHNSFGYERSHGCVNLSVGDAHWLFNWANEGDYVYVYDPSGRTPTDPSLYGAGAP